MVTPEQIQNINLSGYVTINPNITIFQQYPQLRAIVISAITQAVKEIISPVVERSVTIACITSRYVVCDICEVCAQKETLHSSPQCMKKPNKNVLPIFYFFAQNILKDDCLYTEPCKGNTNAQTRRPRNFNYLKFSKLSPCTLKANINAQTRSPRNLIFFLSSVLVRTR